MEWSWESIPEYLETLDRRLGVNVGALIGFSAVRRYVMGEAAYADAATPEQIESMKAIIREGMAAGALGLSSERNLRHMDIEGRVLPANVATSDEFISVAEALAEVGAGSIQFGDAEGVEEKEGLISRLGRASGRPIIPTFGARGSGLEGSRIYPMVDPFVENPARWTLLTVATFDAIPTWGSVMTTPPDERRRLFEDPDVRERMRVAALQPDRRRPESGPAIRWSAIVVANTMREHNRQWVGKTVAEVAQAQGKDPLDAFLDLGLDEDLATVFYQRSNVTVEGKAAAVTNPRIILGLSDSGAHVTRRCNSHFSTYILSYWVREMGALTLEEAVRKLTYVPATAFGMHDRGLIRPGLAADLTVFDPDAVSPGEMDEVADFPGGAVRMRRLCQGVDYTIVNGQILIEEGEHTGAYPGRVVRSSVYAQHTR
jgi:N-acyl-D-aspartate/D-glutamate deacylase